MVGYSWLLSVITFTIVLNVVTAHADTDLSLAIAESKVEFLNSSDSASKALLDKSNQKLVFFFASYCPHCEAEMPHFLKLKDQLASCKIRAFPFSLDSDISEAKRVLSQWSIKTPALFDSSKKIRNTLKIKRIPHTVWLNPSGFVIKEASGASEFQILANEISKDCKNQTGVNL